MHYPPILVFIVALEFWHFYSVFFLKLCIMCYAFDISNYKRNRVSVCYDFNISNHKRNRLEFANNSDLCKHVLHDHKVEQYTMGQLLPEVVFAILRLSMLSRIGIMKLTGWLRNSYPFDFIEFLTPLCNRKLSTRKQMCSQPSSQLENELYLLYCI